MPPKLEYFLVSESVAVDALTNRISIFNVLEVVKSRRLPAVYPSLHAVSVWLIDDEDRGHDYQAVVRIAVPGGESNEFPINFTPNGRRHRLFQRTQGIRIPQGGIVRFELLLNGEHVAQHLVDVQLAGDTLQPTNEE